MPRSVLHNPHPHVSAVEATKFDYACVGAPVVLLLASPLLT